MPDLEPTLLKHLPPFGQLDDAQIREILDLSRAKLVRRNQKVFGEGEEAEHFFLLLDGHLLVERLTPDGDRVIPLHIPPGQLFGIAAALGKTAYPATAMAAQDCLVLQWPMRYWHRFAASYPGFATETYKVVGARLDEVNRRVMELATQRVEQRVATALLSMSSRSSRKTAIGLEIEFPITRRQIAEMTGSTLHTVSRLLSLWQTDGVLQSEKKKISIVDIAKLRTLAGPEL